MSDRDLFSLRDSSRLAVIADWAGYEGAMKREYISELREVPYCTGELLDLMEEKFGSVEAALNYGESLASRDDFRAVRDEILAEEFSGDPPLLPDLPASFIQDGFYHVMEPGIDSYLKCLERDLEPLEPELS